MASIHQTSERRFRPIPNGHHSTSAIIFSIAWYYGVSKVCR